MRSTKFYLGLLLLFCFAAGLIAYGQASNLPHRFRDGEQVLARNVAANDEWLANSFSASFTPVIASAADYETMCYQSSSTSWINTDVLLVYDVGRKVYIGPTVASAAELLLGTATDSGNFMLQVASSARIGDGLQVFGTASQGAVTVARTLTVTGDTTISNASASGNIDVTGELDVTSNAAIGGTLDVTGDTSVGNASVSGNLDLVGELDVTSNAAIGGTFDVTGQTTIADELLIGTATDSGDFDLQVASGSLFGAASVTHDLDVGGGLAVTGDTAVTNASASGNIDVTGELTVTGDTSVSNASASGNVDVTGELGVTGQTTVANASATGNFQVGTSKLLVNTGGNVGIGTSTPQCKQTTLYTSTDSGTYAEAFSLAASTTMELDTLFGEVSFQIGMVRIICTSDETGGCGTFYLAHTTGATEITDALTTFGVTPDADDVNIYEGDGGLANGKYCIQNHTAGARSFLVIYDGNMQR